MPSKCRICLLKIEPTNFTNIFTTCKTGQLISEVLTSFAPVQVSENDGLPDCLCSSCEEKVNILIDFRMLIVSSDSEFRQQCEEKFDLEDEMSADPELRQQCEEKFHLEDEMSVQDVFKFEVEESHFERIDNVEEFACEFCKVVFSSAHDLEKHEVIHDPDKPFICYTCPRSFKSQSLIVRHNKILHSETGYKCYRCEQHFQLYSSLKSHLKTHIKAKTNHSRSNKKHLAPSKHRQKRRLCDLIVHIGKMSQDLAKTK